MKQNQTLIKNVALIDLGEGLEINLNTLEKKLNSIQKTFKFKEIGVITCESIGDPKIDNLWYDSTTLFEALRKCYPLPKYDYVVGITNFKMTHEESTDEKSNGDMAYFSISDSDRFSLVSINDVVYRWNSKSKNIYQYTAYQIITELIINMTGNNLMHSLSNACLFDDCEDRSTFAKSINKSYICNRCYKQVKECNINDQTIGDVQNILRYCRKNDLKTSLINTAKHPATNLAVGAVIGWGAQVYAKDASDSHIIAIALAFFLLIVFLYVHHSSK